MFMSVFLKSKIKFFREKIQDFSPYNEWMIFWIYIINHKCSSCSSSALHIPNFTHYVVMLEKVCIAIIQKCPLSCWWVFLQKIKTSSSPKWYIACQIIVLSVLHAATQTYKAFKVSSMMPVLKKTSLPVCFDMCVCLFYIRSSSQALVPAL